MKTCLPYILYTLVLVITIAGCQPTAESGPPVPATDSVPGHLEPHHLLHLQNGYVRVAETYLAPGATTLAHSHPIDAAVIFLTDARLQIEHDDGTIEDSPTVANTVAYGAAPTVHKTMNVGSEDSRVTVVEIFARPPQRGAVGNEISQAEVLLENDTVRMSKFRLKAGDTLPELAASVVVVLQKGTLTSSADDVSKEYRVGDVLWAGLEGSQIRNDGTTAIEAIIVQIKGRE